LPTGSEGQTLRIKQGIPVWDNESFICGSTLSDIDNNIYSTVRIGTQCWMAENLRVSSYNDGTPIPIVTDGSQWSSLTTGGRSWYNNDSTTNEIPYGNLYNGYAVKGIASTGSNKNICPIGWHVPSDFEWTALEIVLGGILSAGNKMKSTGTTYWFSESGYSDNSSGFSGLPGGFRLNDGNFTNIRNSAFFWSTTESLNNTSDQWGRELYHDRIDLNRSTGRKSVGASVRCLRD
jgi:uncharacterized protein (TIGR02145 family)